MAPRVSGRRDGTNMMVTCGPDVCLTPMGSGMVPVAYSSVALFDPSARLSDTVFNNVRNDFQLNTRAGRVTGHEPGTGRGVVVSGYLTYSHAKVASDSVFSEGWAVVRDQDPAWINHPDLGPTEPRRGEGEILLAASGGTPGNNQAQNKQVNDVVRILGLTPAQRRLLHLEISGQGYGFHEIMGTAKSMFNK